MTGREESLIAMRDPMLQDELMDAASAFDVAAVRRCLERGADPNSGSGSDDASDPAQPTTPLKMVVFRISDNLLEDADLAKFELIAALLLEYGADPKAAMALAETRYGPYELALPDTPFTRVLHVIAQWKGDRSGS